VKYGQNLDGGLHEVLIARRKAGVSVSAYLHSHIGDWLVGR
jgi:hypothetical protein